MYAWAHCGVRSPGAAVTSSWKPSGMSARPNSGVAGGFSCPARSH